MQVVILAAGLGTRLRPLTYDIPKPMVPIRGKPFLEYQLELIKKNGFKDIVICISRLGLGEVIKNHFGAGEKLKVNIAYSIEDKPGGTGGALKNAENLLENEFLLLYGDSLLDIDYPALVEYFHKHGKMGTIVVFNNKPKIISNNTEINKKNQVINYNKNKEGPANCVEAGVLAFKKDILNFIPAKTPFSLEEELFPVLIDKNELMAYTTSQKFYDIGTFESLEIFKNLEKKI